MMPSPVQIAVRAWTTTRKTQGHWPFDRGPIWPDTVLIFDTETTVDETQRLLFGFYRLCRWAEDGALACEEESIFCSSNLRQRDPVGWKVLERYARAHQQDIVGRVPRPIVARSRHNFVDDIFYSEAYDTRSLVVGFNLPFDLSRLAVRASPARDRGTRDAGGFSLSLFQRWDRATRQYVENTRRPRLVIVSLDSKRALMHFKNDPNSRMSAGSADEDASVKRPRYRGRFLDLRTLVFALTNESHSLASACKIFGAPERKLDIAEHGKITPEYVEYARQDVKATQALLVKVRQEFDRHPIDLQPDRAYSPASIAKAYLAAMGVAPLLGREP